MANNKKNKHLTPEDRRQIEECLGKCMTFKAIARLIEKNPTTVSYEVKHHRQELRNAYSTLSEPCPQLLKAPFVCNGCKKRHSASCHFIRFLYRAVPAQKEYKALLSDAREGIPLNKKEFYENDRIISEGLKKGQHLYHILASSPQIRCSKSTVYRHFHKGYFSASLLDLPRALKFKPRKQKKSDSIPKGLRSGRSFSDFCSFLQDNRLERHTELDTLIGRPGGKVILTIHFTSCNFMAGLLLPDKSALSAASAFRALKDRLRSRGFSIAALFDVFLTDNGGEFADVSSFEDDANGFREISMFFCDPMSPSQKPQIEKNHTLFRDIVPKGSSFEDFSQDTVNRIFSHVNAVSRAIYSGKSAYDMFCFLYSQELASLLGISYVKPADVIQSPALLKGLADLKKGR